MISLKMTQANLRWYWSIVPVTFKQKSTG